MVSHRRLEIGHHGRTHTAEAGTNYKLGFYSFSPESWLLSIYQHPAAWCPTSTPHPLQPVPVAELRSHPALPPDPELRPGACQRADEEEGIPEAGDRDQGPSFPGPFWVSATHAGFSQPRCILESHRRQEGEATRSPIFHLCLKLWGGQRSKVGKVRWVTAQDPKALSQAGQPCPFRPGLLEG